jgi:hypothetical protein
MLPLHIPQSPSTVSNMSVLATHTPGGELAHKLPRKLNRSSRFVQTSVTSPGSEEECGMKAWPHGQKGKVVRP